MRARSKSFDDAMAAVIKKGIVKPTEYPYIYPRKTTEVTPKVGTVPATAAMAAVIKEGNTAGRHRRRQRRSGFAEAIRGIRIED